jgi:hypothetical protein
LEGGANTRFFHLVANDKHRKQLIYRLEDDNGVAVSSGRLKCHIMNYYKNLFGIPERARTRKPNEKGKLAWAKKILLSFF